MRPTSIQTSLALATTIGDVSGASYHKVLTALATVAILPYTATDATPYPN